MKKFLLAAVAALAVAAPASAADFLLNYTAINATSPFAATVRITVANVLNSAGTYDILSARGNVDGDVISGLVNNPAQPNASFSADGFFIYDNTFTPVAPVVTNPGILFNGASGLEYNLFSDNATQYELYKATPGVGYVNSVGTLSVLAVPEPAQWALMLGGFGLMGGALRRRRSASTTVFA